MNIRPTFATNPQATKLMQPGNRPFNHPAVDAESTAMFGIPFCCERFDAHAAQCLPVGLRVVRSVALHDLWAAPRTSALASNGRNRFH